MLCPPCSSPDFRIGSSDVFQRHHDHVFFLERSSRPKQKQLCFFSFIITALLYNKTQRKLLLLNRMSDKAERWRAHHTKRQIAVIMIIT